MVAVIASCVAGGALLVAATLKLADRPAALVALGTYGLGGRAAAPALWALVAIELALGTAVLAGSRAAAIAAAGLFAAFALAQLTALAAGRGGAPCGCLGGRGRVSLVSAARALVLGAAATLAAAAPPGGGREWAITAAAAACAAAVALGRRAPDGALDVAGEGPEVGVNAPAALPTGPALVLFTAGGCRLCARVRRGLGATEAGLPVVELDEERDAAAWLAAGVPGAPYAVAIDRDGVVRAKGTVNTPAQVRGLAAAAGAARPPGTSRRRFLERAAGAAATAAAADTVARLVRPGEAEAYHFCGHIYTTDSCPHPTGLPRVDARGYPLRARDGHRVDDLGRAVDREGVPVDEDGRPLLDADGRPLPRAPRTRVCTATGRRYGFRPYVDGAWYRCCGGRVRKLVDCCTTGRRRINGDGALHGYCYRGRRVFCVMYYQTKVPC
ncbi:MAG TPA: MauE/DoxX family redox-associated membrane protein [Solirubrobacteraceae bacterium]|nr:MauE/DoxX family redox-associated membrane protein [Solirubrobacteraceae bacterium]